MTTSPGTSWAGVAAARSLDDFRYPGPRPLRRADTQLLVGRDKDVARLTYQIYSYPVVEITAPSGTGKSSLLAAGVIPALEDYGFTVVTLRSWAEVRGETDAEHYYHALRQAFVDSPQGEPSDLPPVSAWPADSAEGLEWVVDKFGGALVVIFDQLEELMRVDAPRAQRFLEYVVRVAHEGHFRQVLSLRSEFKAQLNVVESRLGIKQWQWYPLKEVDAEHAPEIIRAPREQDVARRAEAWPIDTAVEDVVATSWKAAKEHDPTVGLLHLQAILWVLEQEVGSDETLWTAAAAERSALFNGLAAEDGHRRRAAVASSLESYIGLAMGHLATTLVVKDRPKAGAETRYAAARFVDDLSSAGYKIPMSVDDLFLKCYEGLQDLRKDKTQISRLRRLWESEDDVAAGDPESLHRVAVARMREWRRNPDALDDDPLVLRDRFFSGRLWKLEALEGLCELEVVFQRALSWLESRGIVRIAPASDGVPIATLIHDGFGMALNAWAERVLAEPESYFTALVGENGTSVLGGEEDRHLQVVGRRHKGKRIDTGRALQWSGCSIDFTDFRDVVFRNCDFRGTVFYGCTFDGTEFVDCYMPGALFLDSHLEGAGLVFTDTITRTVSFMGGEAVAPAMVVFDKIRAAAKGELSEEQFRGADGLFLESFKADWEIRRSKFKHLSVVNCGAGKIMASDIHLVHFDQLPSQVQLVRTDLRYVVSQGMPDGSGPTIIVEPV